MAFDAGAIVGKSKLDTSDWQSGINGMLKSVVSFAAIAKGVSLVSDAIEHSIKLADEYQKSFSNISTIVDTSAVSMTELSRQVLALNPNLGSATEIANGLYQAFSSGATTAAEAMDITVQSAKFGKAALTDTKTAVDAITTAINAYGKEQINATKASDIFFQVIKDGKIEGDELASSIGRSIPLFSSVGISLEQLGAGIATLTQVGVSGHESMTQLNAVVNSFLKPSDAMVQALKSVGYESGATFLKAEGLTGALKFLQDRTGGAADKLSELLPNVDAVRGAMGLSGASAEFYAKALDDINNSAGSTQVAFDRQEKTFATMQSAFDNLSITVGNIGKHYVDDLAVGATLAAEATQQFLNSTEGMNLMAETAGNLAGAFTLIKEVVKPFTDALGPGFASILKTAGETVAKLKGDANAANPILYTLATAGQTIALGFKLGVVSINSVIKSIGSLIGVVGSAANAFRSLLEDGGMRGDWEKVGKNISSVWTNIEEFASTAVGNYKDFTDTFWTEISQFGKNVDNQTKTITLNVKSAYTDAKKDVVSNFGQMTTGATSASTAMLDALAKLRAGVSETTSDLGTALTAAEVNLMNLTKQFYHSIVDVTELTLDQRKIALDEFKNAGMLTEQQYADAVFSIWRESNKELSAYYDNLTGTTKLSLSERRAALDGFYAEGLISSKQYADETVILWIEAYNEITREAMKFANAGIQAASYLVAQVSSIVALGYENDKAKLDNKYGAELALLEKSHDEKLITDEAYTAKRKEIEARQKTEQNELAKKQFEANKWNQIATATISASQAIMGWWQAAAQLGPIFGPPFAGTMTGLTGALLATQIGAIASQEFVPAYAGGGKAQAGLAQVNENGGELQLLRDGTIIVPADISEAIAASSSGGQSFTINFPNARFNDRREADLIASMVSKKLGSELKKVRGK